MERDFANPEGSAGGDTATGTVGNTGAAVGANTAAGANTESSHSVASQNLNQSPIDYIISLQQSEMPPITESDGGE
jgi:hypothetical protein